MAPPLEVDNSPPASDDDYQLVDVSPQLLPRLELPAAQLPPPLIQELQTLESAEPQQQQQQQQQPQQQQQNNNDGAILDRVESFLSDFRRDMLHLVFVKIHLFR